MASPSSGASIAMTTAERLRATVRQAPATLIERLAVAPPWLQLPAVDSYLGYEQADGGGPLVHVHAYHRIVIGPPWRTTYTVPLAETVLAGASPGFVVRAPAPEHELLLMVLQAAQR